MSLLTDVRDYILTMKEVQLGPRQLFTGVERDPLDPSVTLYTGAMGPITQTQDQVRPALELFGIQLTVRDRHYREAEELADRLYDLFWIYTAPYPYETIWPTSPPRSLGGGDPAARWEVGFPLRAQRIAPVLVTV